MIKNPFKQLKQYQLINNQLINVRISESTMLFGYKTLKALAFKIKGNNFGINART